MKIIYQEDPKLWSYKFTCKTCNTVAEADCNDVIVDDIHESSEYFYILCPVCKISIIVKNISEVIKIKVRSEYKYSYLDR